MPAWSFVARGHYPRMRTLAHDDGARLVTENGEELPSASYQEWVRSAVGYKCDVRVANVGLFRYLVEAIQDSHATVSAAQNQVDSGPHLVRVDWRCGSGRATLVGDDSWQGADLTDQRACLDLLGIGTYATPAGLGTALLKKMLWESKENIKSDLRQVGGDLASDLAEATVGMRTETPAEDGTYAEEVTELDRSSAYVHECLQDIPCGKVRPFSDETYLGENEWYIAECAVTVLRDLSLGPFPLRAKDGSLSWPTIRGVYQNVWLTRGEIEDTRAAGVLVQIVHGWAWSDRRPFLRPWAKAILAARARVSGVVAACIKLVGNATIGRLAMQGQRLSVVSADSERAHMKNASGTTGPLILDGNITYYEAIPSADDPAVTLPHVALFVWSEARRKLYHYQLELLARGKVVFLTNTDGILVVGDAGPPRIGWRVKQTLRDVVIVTNRSYVGTKPDGKLEVVLPGQTERIREQAIQFAQLIVLKEQQWRQDHPAEWANRLRKLKANGGLLDSLSAKRWPDYGTRSGMPDHLSDLADVVISAGPADSTAGG